MLFQDASNGGPIDRPATAMEPSMPDNQPRPGKLMPVGRSYPLHTATTTNGIKVAVNPDPWVSGVAVNLWYDVGSVHEDVGKTGFAHLFEHLMFAGSANVASGEHLALLQAIGGDANASTSFDRTNYYETVPKGALNLSLWLEAERLTSLLDAVDQTNLDTERAVVKEEKRQRYDNVPYGDAFALIMALVFADDHPYAHLPIGSMADIDSATLGDVQAFFRRHYRPNNLILTLSGAVEPAEGFALVEQYFAAITPAVAAPERLVKALPPRQGIPRAEVRADVPQDATYCCWLTPPISDPLRDPLGLGLSVLAGSMTTRLHKALVRSQLAHTVDSFDLGLRYGNSMVVTSATCVDGVTPEQVEETMMATWEQFCAEGPTAEELQRAKRAEERDFLASLAGIEDRADQISGAWSLFGDPEELNQHLDTVHALSADAVGQAIADWTNPQNRAVLTYRRSR